MKKPFIIAETAYNHQGDLNYLCRMIDDIAELKLNAIKFHLLLNPESYFQSSHPLINSIKDWMFSREQWKSIINRSRSKGLEVIALCDDVESLQFINKTYPDIFGIELHATSVNDYFMLKESSNFKGQLLLGIGGCTTEEINFALNIWGNEIKYRVILMYGFQNYPTNYGDINLSKMRRIKNLFEVEVGYADHTAYNDPENESISCMAAMMGFPVLEKHYTPDPGIERLDFHSAVGKKQMKRIKELVETALQVYGDGSLQMSEAELSYGDTGPMKKAIIARKDIQKGTKLSLENLWYKRTNQSATVLQKDILKLIGLETNRDIKKDDIIDFGMVDYKFSKSNLSDFTHTKKENK